MEAFGLDTERDETETRPVTPSSVSESEIYTIAASKNVFRPAFLTITNLDFPQETGHEADNKAHSKKRARYKTIPKNCSAYVHRMFVKSDYIPMDDDTRASSRASTDYDEYEFEEYLREFNIPDDSSECSLFDSSEEDDTFRKHPRTILEKCLDEDEQRPTPKPQEEPTVTKTVQNPTKEPNASNHHHKKEKRKSLTLSRIPSPETVQIIRIDVITGYPIDSDNSVLSGMTDHTDRASSVESYGYDSCQRSAMTHDHATQTVPMIEEGVLEGLHGGRSRQLVECDHLLYCKSLNLTDRLANTNHKS